MRYVQTGGVAGRSREPGATRVGGTRGKRGRGYGVAHAADFANASGCVDGGAGSGALEDSGGAPDAARRTDSRGAAGGLFSADGAAAGFYPGWRRYDAVGRG